MASSKNSSLLYVRALERLNENFRRYNEYSTQLNGEKLLHFTSQQFCNISNIMKFYQKGSSIPEQLEEMRHNVELLKDLKITCAGEYIVELQQFRSLEHLYIVGPCIRGMKGLRAVSTNLKSLIVESGSITLHDLLSLCCMDESRPMSWPCLLSLKISNCSLTSLDSSLKLLPNLQELDLSFNRLNTNGVEFCSLDQLTHLNLSFNRIREISQFSGGIRWQLQYLYLSYNELSTLKGLHMLGNLLELDLSHNMLLKHDDLQPLRYLSLLRKLDLRGNPLFFNSHHKKMSLRCISPEALKPDFIFDGKHLSPRDLEVGQYTPNAVSAHPHRLAVGELASINSMEPEAYDVSMSSAANASGRQAEGDSYFKLCSQSRKKKRIAAKTLIRTEVCHGVSEDFSIQPLADTSIQLSQDDFSVVSQTSGDSECGSVSSTTASDGLLDSSHGVNGDYLTLGGVARIDDDHEDDSNESECHSVVDDESSTQGLVTIENSTSSEKLDVGHSIVPSMRAKRFMCNSSDASSGDDILLTLTSTHLVESSVMDGTILEKLELSSVKNVAMSEKQVMELKFSYVKTEKRMRRYAFIENCALENINQLYGELDLISLHNNKLNSQDFTCLKCSRRFSAAKILPKDKAGDIAATICHCGSDLVVRADDQADDKKLFFFAGDEHEECHEAFESKVGKDEQNVSASINVVSQSIENCESLSWIHTVHSVPDVAGVFGKGRLHGADDSHLSESLPNDLCGVSLQSQYPNLRSTVSATVVDNSQQLVTPSKTFSHLLAPHPDLYKLVNVTSSTVAGQSKNFTGLSIDPMSKSKIEGCTIEATPQAAKPTGAAGDPVDVLRRRQVMVTSTPRRRWNHTQSETVRNSCPSKSLGKLEVPHHRRALAFTQTCGAPLPVSEAVSGLSDQRPLSLDLKDRTATSPRMEKFINEELLEDKEELVAVFQTGLLHETGAVLRNLPALAGNSGKKGLFRSPKPVFPSSSQSPLGKEVVSLLVLSNLHIHILQAENQTNPTLPENLKCFASHSLSSIIGLDIGLSGCSLYVAFGLPQELNKKKFSSDDIAEVFALQFRNSVKCKRFYHSCLSLLLDNTGEFEHSAVKETCQSASSTKNDDDSLELSSPFSDFLEKGFSEDVLMHLDLHMPDTVYQKHELLKDELFSYHPCWMLNDGTGKEVSVAVVISCGGSLCVVLEDIKQVLYEFVTALARTKQESTAAHSLSDSLSSISHNSYGIASSSIHVRSSAHYSYESLTECSKLENIVRFNDQPECVQLNFNATADLGPKRMWHLRFSDPHSITTLQHLLEAYYEAKYESSLPVLWR